MKSIHLKAFFLALSFFTFSAIFAQDTTNKPKPDTTKPKHDSTSMAKQSGAGLLCSNIDAINSSLINDDKIAARKEDKKEEKIA